MHLRLAELRFGVGWGLWLAELRFGVECMHFAYCFETQKTQSSDY